MSERRGAAHAAGREEGIDFLAQKFFRVQERTATSGRRGRLLGVLKRRLARMRDTVDAHRVLLLESSTTRTASLSEPSRVTGGDALGRDHTVLSNSCPVWDTGHAVRNNTVTRQIFLILSGAKADSELVENLTSRPRLVTSPRETLRGPYARTNERPGLVPVRLGRSEGARPRT